MLKNIGAARKTAKWMCKSDMIKAGKWDEIKGDILQHRLAAVIGKTHI